MLELEENLLYKLTTTQGSLVDDETVLEVLNTTRNTAADVREKLTVARDTEIMINAAREEYRYLQLFWCKCILVLVYNLHYSNTMIFILVLANKFSDFFSSITFISDHIHILSRLCLIVV